MTGQDRTTKSHKSVLHTSHIWRKAPRKAIAMKCGTGVNVHEVVTRQSLIFKS